MARRARGAELWRKWRSCAAAGPLAAIVAAAASAQGDSIALAIKATFLVRFGSYVDWPPEAFSGPRDPINLCVIGEDPFGALIDNAAEDERVNGRALRVVRLEAFEANAECHIAYVAGSPRQAVHDVLEEVGDAPVLTVTDAEVEGGLRGAIHFVVADDRVRFHIDEAAAADNGLALNSRLLAVALTVERRSEP